MIEMMKFDMGGSGAALGAARALAALQPPGVEVRRFSWSRVALDARWQLRGSAVTGNFALSPVATTTAGMGCVTLT